MHSCFSVLVFVSDWLKHVTTMLECLRAHANIQTEKKLLALLTIYGVIITLLHIGKSSLNKYLEKSKGVTLLKKEKFFSDFDENQNLKFLWSHDRKQKKLWRIGDNFFFFQKGGRSYILLISKISLKGPPFELKKEEFSNSTQTLCV